MFSSSLPAQRSKSIPLNPVVPSIGILVPFLPLSPHNEGIMDRLLLLPKIGWKKSVSDGMSIHLSSKKFSKMSKALLGTISPKVTVSYVDLFA